MSGTANIETIFTGEHEEVVGGRTLGRQLAHRLVHAAVAVGHRRGDGVVDHQVQHAVRDAAREQHPRQRVLQRRRSADIINIRQGAQFADEAARAIEVAEPPAGHRPGFRKGIYGDGPFKSAGKRGD